VGVYDLITYAGGIGGSGFAGFQLAALPFGVVAHLQDSGTAVQLNITAVTIEPGIWVGNVLGQWNLAGGLEWKGATSGNPQPYHDLDVVTFDDSASNFTVNVTANVSPTIAHVNNTATYTFAGVASIVGVGSVAKDGPGNLLILNSNTYSGGTFITNGTITLGNGGTSGSILGPVLNDGAIVANRSDTNSLANISGSGSLEQRGTGLFILGGANTYTGLTTVSFGTLATASGTALGDVSGGTVVASGATLDVNSQALGDEHITVSGAGVGGNGAIVNNGTGDQVNATRFVTLTGPTTFGGAFRWDIRNPNAAGDPTGGTLAALVANTNDLTKVSSNVIALISAGDTGLRDINVRGGTLTFSRSTTLGDPSRTVTVYPGATLQFHRTSEYENNIINKVTVMTNATLAVESNGLTNQIASPITLSGSNIINLPSATGFNLQGSITGDGSVTATSAGALIISGNASYTGGTTISGGFLQVDGSLGTGGHPLVITGPTVIGGNGTILDPIGTLPAGCTLTPGDSVGGLTLSGSLVMAPGSSNVFEINKDFGTNDVVKGLSSVTLGGTLVLNNVGSTSYAPGDSFKLYYAGSYGGSFSAIVPATPALGLVWVTNTLSTSGTIGVALLPNPLPLVVNSASSLVHDKVNVIFSAALEQTSAEDPTNYKLSAGNPSVLSATLVSPTNVLLTLDAPITNASFIVNVKNVHDQAFVPNVVTTTNAPGIAIGFLDAVPVLATNGSAFAYGTNGVIKVFSDGADIINAQDTFEFVYSYFTNDFDIAVMLQSLAITDPAAKAGLMAREIDNALAPLYDDRFFMSAGFTADSTRNNNFVEYRESQGATAIAPGSPRPPATYPTNWLRLKRTGSVFQGFCGSNGLDWTPMSAVDSSTNAPGPYPDVIRVGLAVTAHNSALTTEAIFSNFGKAVERGNLSFAVSGNFLVVSWQPSLIGATLQTTSDITPPSSWAPVAGSTTTNLVYIPIGTAPAFFRLKN
jgi:autotransporter-associated beta strand protein